MHARTAAGALLSGLAVLLVVGAAVTELAAARIESSLLVGIPAGLVAGVATAAFVFERLENPEPAGRRQAVAVAAFGLVFVAALLVGVLGAGFQNSVAFPIAAVMAAVAAAGAYIRA